MIFSLFSCSTGKDSVPDEADGEKSVSAKQEQSNKKQLPEDSDAEINNTESQPSSTASLDTAENDNGSDDGVLKENNAPETDSGFEKDNTDVQTADVPAENGNLVSPEADKAPDNGSAADSSVKPEDKPAEAADSTEAKTEKAQLNDQEGSLPVEDGTGRSSGTGWAKKIKNADNPPYSDNNDGAVKTEEASTAAADSDEKKLPEQSSFNNTESGSREASPQEEGSVLSVPSESEPVKVSDTGSEPVGNTDSENDMDNAKNEGSLETADADDKSEEDSNAADYKDKADDYLTALAADPDEKDAAGTGRKYRTLSAPSSAGGSYYSPEDELRERPLQSSNAGVGDSGDADDIDAEDKASRQTVEFNDPSHIVVILEGTGWIFTGSAEKDEQITFLSRSFDDGKTVFSFRAAGGNSYILKFQQQRNNGSSIDSEIELVRKKPLSEGDEEAAEKSSPEEGEPVQEGIIINKTDISLQEPEEKAEEYTADDFDFLFKDALSLMDKGEYGKAAEKLEKIKSTSDQFPETDRLYYLLGQCYEKNEEKRDPVKAEMYYSMVLDQFPFSLYYDKAETRKRYLLKYFINIR